MQASPARRFAGGHTSDVYWTFISPFGGVSAATALRAVLEHPDRLGDPLALTVNFCAPIAKGDFAVHTRRVRANRSSQHWQVEFRQGDSDEPVLTASIVMAVRRETWSHRLALPPALTPWDETKAFPNASSLSWVARYQFRFAEGSMIASEEVPVPPRSPRSVLWLKDAEPRPLDFLSVAAMSDAFFGRLFHMLGRFPPFGTVSLTTYFHANGEELAAHGTEPLAGVADAHVFHRGFGDQTVELYGAGGQLLATSAQVTYFRY